MKSRRIPLESEVDKYEVGKGMEDGFELFSDVVTKGWIVTDSLVKSFLSIVVSFPAKKRSRSRERRFYGIKPISSLGNWHLSDRCRQVAGLHRASPSASLDKDILNFTYYILTHNSRLSTGNFSRSVF